MHINVMSEFSGERVKNMQSFHTMQSSRGAELAQQAR